MSKVYPYCSSAERWNDFYSCRDRGAGGAGGGGLQPPNNFGTIFFSIEKLLFYCCLTAPGRFEVGTGTPLFPVTPEQVYRRIYFEALDLIERFDQPSFKAYSNIESLLIGVLSSQDVSSQKDYMKENYADNVRDWISFFPTRRTFESVDQGCAD